MESFVASDGMRLAYVIDDFTDPWKRAPTLLLLHAAMGSARRYFAWVPTLARHYRVVRMDLRGHGASEIPPADRALTLERLVGDVAELMDHLDLASAHVVGNSAGGYLGQQLAMNQGSRVRSLLLFGRPRASRTARRRAGSRRLQPRGCVGSSPRRSPSGCPSIKSIRGLSSGFSTKQPKTTRLISPNSCC